MLGVRKGDVCPLLAPRPQRDAWCPRPRPGGRVRKDRPGEGAPRLSAHRVAVLSPLQGYEDWLRHKADNAMNQCPVHFIQHGKLVRKQSRKLRVSESGVFSSPDRNRPDPERGTAAGRYASGTSVRNCFLTGWRPASSPDASS